MLILIAHNSRSLLIVHYQSRESLPITKPRGVSFCLETITVILVKSIRPGVFRHELSGFLLKAALFANEEMQGLGAI